MDDFTAATCAISFNKTLGEKASFSFFNKKILYRNYLKSTGDKEVLSLTIWNKSLGFSSRNNKSRITHAERAMLKLTLRAKSMIIGIILSDGWMQKKGHWNPRFALKQSIKNFPYLWHVYNELAYLCSGPLYSSKNMKRG